MNNTSALTPPRAHGARPRAGRGGGTPEAEERHVLERTLGAELRAVRSQAGMSQKALAERAGVSYWSLQGLEAGRRRPSGAMLQALAVGSTRCLPPVGGLDAGAVLGRLLAAAGGSLVADTAGGIRRRKRRLRDAGHLYHQVVERWWAGEVAAAQRAEIAFVTAMRILEVPGALDDARALQLAMDHLDVHSRWLRQGRPGPYGTTSEFRDYARSKGYPVQRQRGRLRPRVSVSGGPG